MANSSILTFFSPYLHFDVISCASALPPTFRVQCIVQYANPGSSTWPRRAEMTADASAWCRVYLKQLATFPPAPCSLLFLVLGITYGTAGRSYLWCSLSPAADV